MNRQKVIDVVEALEKGALVGLGLLIGVRVLDTEGAALFALLALLVYSAWRSRSTGRPSSRSGS